MRDLAYTGKDKTGSDAVAVATVETATTATTATEVAAETIPIAATAEPAKEGRTVAVCGFAPSSRHYIVNEKGEIVLAPEVEVWGLNDAFSWMPPMRPGKDRWFQIHSLKAIQDAQHMHKWLLEDKGAPVYMIEAYPQYPSAVAYPYAEVIEPVHGAGYRYKEYYTTAVAYMLAEAVREYRHGVRKILLLGIDMSTKVEYRDQLASVCYWLGVAHGVGIEVFVPPESPILHAPRYGMEFKQFVTIDDMKDKYEGLQEQEVRAEKNHLHAKGAMELGQAVLKDMGLTLAAPPEDKESPAGHTFRRTMESVQAQQKFFQELIAVHGAMQVVEQWLAGSGHPVRQTGYQRNLEEAMQKKHVAEREAEKGVKAQ